MKTIFTFIAAAIIVSVASAQGKLGTPQPVPMTAPARVQNTQNTQQNSQNSSAPKPSGTSTETKKAENGKATESAPAVDNKIAVSDPGTPGDKSSKKAAPAETKKAPTTGVSPK